MTKREWIIIVVACLLAAGIGVGIYRTYEKAKLNISEAYSAKEDAMARDHAQKASEANDRILELQKVATEHQKVADAASRSVASLKVERDALLKKLADAPLPSDERDVIIAKDAEVIAAMDKQVTSQAAVIADQKQVIDQSIVSIAHWQAAYQDEARSRAGLQIALDAQKAINKSSMWIYRGQGFAIGVGTGAVAGLLLKH